MPRTLQEIVDHAEELSAAFEDIQPDPADGRDPAPLLQAREAVQARARAEADVVAAVAAMRTAGYSWQSIGAVVGTSGESARQRYGRDASKKTTSGGTVKVARAAAKASLTLRRVPGGKVTVVKSTRSLAKSTAKQALRSSTTPKV